MSTDAPWKSPDVVRDAVLSECKTYRYRLTRRWDAGPLLWWCLINPSRANDVLDDPTADKCCGYAHREGYAGIGIVNLFAYISTDPKRLTDPTIDPVGPRNDTHLLGVGLHVAQRGDGLVVGWGTNVPRGSHRGAYVVGMFRTLNLPLLALRVCKGGEPWHPLYLSKKLTPQPYAAEVYRR